MKKSNKLVFIFLILFSVGSLADECTREVPKPVVIKKDLVKNYILSDLKERILLESFVLNSGQKVQIEQAGCHHFGLSYIFEVDSISREKIIPRSREIIKSIVDVAPSLSAQKIYKALMSVSDEDTFVELITITEGYESLHISTIENDNTSLITLVYDVAL